MNRYLLTIYIATMLFHGDTIKGAERNPNPYGGSRSKGHSRQFSGSTNPTMHAEFVSQPSTTNTKQPTEESIKLVKAAVSTTIQKTQRLSQDLQETDGSIQDASQTEPTSAQATAVLPVQPETTEENTPAAATSDTIVPGVTFGGPSFLDSSPDDRFDDAQPRTQTVTREAGSLDERRKRLNAEFNIFMAEQVAYGNTVAAARVEADKAASPQQGQVEGFEPSTYRPWEWNFPVNEGADSSSQRVLGAAIQKLMLVQGTTTPQVRTTAEKLIVQINDLRHLYAQAEATKKQQPLDTRLMTDIGQITTFVNKHLTDGPVALHLPFKTEGPLQSSLKNAKNELVRCFVKAACAKATGEDGISENAIANLLTEQMPASDLLRIITDSALLNLPLQHIFPKERHLSCSTFFDTLSAIYATAHVFSDPNSFKIKAATLQTAHRRFLFVTHGPEEQEAVPGCRSLVCPQTGCGVSIPNIGSTQFALAQEAITTGHLATLKPERDALKKEVAALSAQITLAQTAYNALPHTSSPATLKFAGDQLQSLQHQLAFVRTRFKIVALERAIQAAMDTECASRTGKNVTNGTGRALSALWESVAPAALGGKTESSQADAKSTWETIVVNAARKEHYADIERRKKLAQQISEQQKLAILTGDTENDASLQTNLQARVYTEIAGTPAQNRNNLTKALRRMLPPDTEITSAMLTALPTETDDCVSLVAVAAKP